MTLKGKYRMTMYRYIEQDPAIRSGKPCIAGTRITVADVVIKYRYLQQSLEEIADTYNLSLAAVYEAMSYYYDHQAMIDDRIREGIRFAEQMEQQTPSRLAAKLQVG